MPKPSSGSNRYLKAQLRPLTKPVFWASAGLFGLSLFALFSLFRQPNEVLSSGDRDAVVNLDENDSLTPEERARAAEIDDLSVLLKDLDKSKTIDSVSGRLNETQTQNLEDPKAIAELETQQPPSPVATSSSNFQQLPLLNLSPQIQPNSLGGSTDSSGFIGFDPRSSGQAGGNASPQTTTAITPLAAALERNSSNANLAAATNGTSATSIPNTSSSINSTTLTGSQSTGALSNGLQPSASPTPTAPISSPTLATPNYNNFQRTPQNSSDNAYSQLLNPTLAVPTAPLNPTPLSPLLPAQPAATGVSSSLGQAQPSRYNSGAIVQQALYGNAPTSIPQTTQTPVFGAPSRQAAAPTLSNPAPFSVPNTTPGQYSGNGQIKTFANP